jgi:hypothetical protein
VAVKAKSKKARVAPFVAWFKDWEAPTYEEKDAARYESFRIMQALSFIN